MDCTGLKERIQQLDPRRICLIKPSALGDIVQSLPLLPVLKECFPSAEITWVCSDSYAGLLEEHPQLAGVIRFQRRGGLWSWRQTLRQLRDARFDVSIDLQGLARTGIMNWATGAPLRIGLESAREGAQFACHELIPDSGRQVPAHRRYWRVAEQLGAGEYRAAAIVPVRQHELDWADERLEGLRRPLLAIHPGARWRTKRWPVEKFAVLAAKAARAWGFSAVVVGSPGEVATAEHLQQLLNRFAPAANSLCLAGETTLGQLAAVLYRSNVMLANDSGPMHLAAALGTPVLGLFTCTSPVLSGPAGSGHQLLSTQLSCAGSYRKRCPYRGKKHMACHEELSTDRAWLGLQQLVAAHRSTRSDRRAA